MPTLNKIDWIKAAVLIPASAVYCAFIAFIVSFTIGWGGTDGMMTFSQEAVTFWLIAVSPVPVLVYCVWKLRAIWRGERPRT
jgi:hypothetical protein